MTQQSQSTHTAKPVYALSDSLSPESFGGYDAPPPPPMPAPKSPAERPASLAGPATSALGGEQGSAPGTPLLPAVPGSSQLQQPAARGGAPARQERKGGLALPGDRKGLVDTIFFRGKIDSVDLKYMTEVDAALHRRGNPRAYVISGTILVFFILFTIWAHFSMLDEVTRGMGQVVSALPIQEIQNLEGGVLENILVREGQDVEKGQILASIANVRASSDLQKNRDQQAVLLATVARLQAERDGVEPVFPGDLELSYKDVVFGQIDLYRNHKEQRDSELRALQAQLVQREREVQEAKARRTSLSANLALAIEQRDRVKPLMEKGIYAPIDYLRMEQSVVSLRGDLDSVIQTVSKAESAVGEAHERITSRQREWSSTIQDEFNQKNAALAEITGLIAQGTDTVNRKEVRSPVNGKVKRILISTIGGTVPSGATIMEILPVDDNLLIEARISPNDRAFLRISDDPEEKQKAVIKVTAYDFSIYGGLEGSLEYISEDTIEDKDRRGEAYFMVRLLTKTNGIMYQGKMLPIMPGMTAQVDILTGKKSVLSYLLKPIIKAKQNAFRER
ncbi:MAG: HlyD family type I secretion periplasmic adaptor subunit [Deltaproteobacteria bacterium]|jgi:adhesin transport system membrane fusion protein|nr:HlyD family type I secretion periplasmic adaptor subunit [Deltaproteobacteria bacterium]